MLGLVDRDVAAECMYGDTIGAEGNCTITVAPGAGYREAGAVFCSAAHAALDQQEALI